LELGRAATKKGLAITPILAAWRLAAPAKSFFARSSMYHRTSTLINQFYSTCSISTTSTFQFEPSNIYNIDETSFQMGDGQHTFIVIDQRISTGKYTTKGDKAENITVTEWLNLLGGVRDLLLIVRGLASDQRLQNL
jgi:hypothetical protein